MLSVITEPAAERLLSRAHSALRDARIPAPLYNNDAIWELERTQIFNRCWTFLGHESEIPAPGDYVLRPLAETPVIVTRGKDHKIRAFLNVCPHRGNQICRSDQGNAARFKCSYHGWVYSNEGQLVGIPQLKEGYGGSLDKEDWPLREVAVDSYRGLIFGSYDPAIPSLGDYLGGFQFYLDSYLTPEMEVYGPPTRWISEVDWKVQAENTSGDGYHTPTAHGFGFSLGYYPSSAKTQSQGWAVHVPNRGHAIGLGRTPGMDPFFWYPPEIVEAMREDLSPEQFEIFKEVRVSVGLVFPNLSMLSQPLTRIPNQPGTRSRTIRLFTPLRNGQIEVWTWCLVPKAASTAYREEVHEGHIMAFGPAGIFEQDDSENFIHVTRLAGSHLAEDMEFPISMGLDSDVVRDFPGPGVCVTPYINDTNFRNFWATYLSYLDGKPPTVSSSCDEEIPGVLRVG